MSESDQRRGLGAWLSAGKPTSTAGEPNPFLPPVPPPDPDSSEEWNGEESLMVSGPPYPTGAPAPDRPVLAVPGRCTVAAVQDVAVQVAGLHGGAGTSTVASLLGAGALDVGVGLSGLVDLEVPVLLVTRTHAAGLALLRRAVGQWASGGLAPIRLLGVVIVDDSPELSRVLHREVKSLERALRRCWRLRWSEDFRHTPEPPDEAARGGFRRFRRSVLAEARKLSTELPLDQEVRSPRAISPTEGTAS